MMQDDFLPTINVIADDGEGRSMNVAWSGKDAASTLYRASQWLRQNAAVDDVSWVSVDSPIPSRPTWRLTAHLSILKQTEDGG